MQNLKNKVQYIFFDADDTLWENEAYFREAEAEFARVVAPDADPSEIQKLLWEKQENHIPTFGYGSKTYFMGMTDAAIDLKGGKLDRETYDSIKKIITDLNSHKVEIFEGVEETLAYLSQHYRLVLATKGESVEQLDKLGRSGLEKYFFAREVMRNKSEADYCKLAESFSIKLTDLLMIGNSVKSDIIPVINIGGRAILIPHEIVWVHELAEVPKSDRFLEINNINLLKNML